MMTSTPTTHGCPAAIWRLDGGFLTESRPDGTMRLWGLWDHVFGCWDADGIAVTPEWEPLTKLGRWHEPAGERDDSWYNSRAALAAYWAAVPTTVRLEASMSTGAQWAALMARWHNGRFVGNGAPAVTETDTIL